MKLAIVGGAGFIGTRLCSRLRDEGSNFLIADCRQSETFPEQSLDADVTDLAQITSAVEGAAAIINLAAEHRDDVSPRSRYDSVNVEGARNVCIAAEAAGCSTIVFTSSVAVYGFAPADTDENGRVNPYNDYGRTKAEAEEIYIEWQRKDPTNRSLVIVRPTVVFGERNRGNVYNLLNQIASGRFLMVGSGRNRKSMAYVENVAAFLQWSLTLQPGIHLFNYVDKPDFEMNSLVRVVRTAMGKTRSLPRLPFWAGHAAAAIFDIAAKVTGKSFPVSRIRVRKFCATSAFASSAGSAGFVAPVTLERGLEMTLRHEFLMQVSDGPIFYTE